MIEIFTDATTAATTAQLSQSTSLSLFVGVAVSFLSAILVYIARQIWERRKLHTALLTEVEEMEGIDTCAAQMDRINSPPGRQLSPDDVPSANSIPTTIYQSTASKIGLLGGFRRGGELQGAVKFYSKVLRYKSIIREIGIAGQNNGSEAVGGDNNRNGIPVADSDQEDLYNEIKNLRDVKDGIIKEQSFDINFDKYMKEK